jgi:SAM-dependent methyltransferase
MSVRLGVGMANEEMRRFWNEASGPEWLELEEEFDTALAPFGTELLRRAAPNAGEHVLDVGCGFGTTALASAAAVGADGRVMGLDLSAPLLARARERAAERGIANVIWRENDAQDASLPRGHFDLVISRFGVMFFDDPVAAFTNLAGAAKPEGRLHFVCWQAKERNPWYTFPSGVLEPYIELPPPPSGGPGPFAFSDSERVAQVLHEAGWHDATTIPFEPEMLEGAGGNVDRVLKHMVRGPVAAALRAAKPPDREAGLDALRAAIASRTVNGEVRFPTAAWMVGARNSG